ncbi:putative indole-3-acetic acid-amido synthetase GH3.5 [Acorus calamus]|uniref:Indole-3-acetic acid-amido synthetase GH3.5 n=1 Tax=Acorus calamus TaxID=4465 RepID=A0AAV9CB70_ACOCL|nr:putative indole-3-acetic acid-amido synthetase GH3.5 [Acorus calamus]
MGESKHERVIEEFEALTEDAGRVQIETLRRILELNGEAEYLQSFGLGGRTDPESFKACVPLVTHSDLEPYIQRITDGEESPILTGQCVTAISLREYPIKNGKALQFIYSGKQFKTRGGLTASTATTHVFRCDQFKNTMKDTMSQCCSPDEVIFGPDFSQTLYCHLLCGLIYSEEVQFISSTFAHGIVHAFHTFEQIWEELCDNIREGVLSSKVTVPSVRAAVSKLLKPNPKLADDIYGKCSRLSNWYGVMPELWPNAKYVYGIMTGSMELYLKKLRHYAGDLPLVSSDYGSSEGWIGANINPLLPPESVTYAVLPDIAYFEFIPLREELEEQELGNTGSTIVYKELKPVGLTEVKLGEEYELVFTSFAGLYRYRLGDVVKVKGFHNSTPELQFVCRRNLLLTINIDKNTEKDLQLSVAEATKLLADEKIELVDFTSHVDLSTDPGHYVIFWELSGEGSEDVLHACCDRLDLSFVDAGYVSSRKVRTIGPLELRVVRQGTFHKILDHYLGLGAAVSQFKMPRCVNASNAKTLSRDNDGPSMLRAHLYPDSPPCLSWWTLLWDNDLASPLV